MSELGLSLLIPTMNRPSSLAETLVSYMSAETTPAQIIVVDQSADADTRKRNKAVVEKYQKKANVQIVFLEKPSLTAARNTALKLAEEELLVFSDDDVSVAPDTLSNVVRIMQDERIAMIAGLDETSLKQEEGKRSYLMSYLSGTRSFLKRKIGHITRSLLGRYPKISKEHFVQTEWAMGYFFVVRKSVLLQGNILWDEKLLSYAYAEDLDFSSRYSDYARSLGKECILTNEVVVDHRASREYRIPSEKHLEMYVAHRYYLQHKLKKGSKAAVAYTNFCMWLFFLIKKGNYKGMEKAIHETKKHMKEIQSGDFSCFKF